jgi:hypothetical protein
VGRTFLLRRLKCVALKSGLCKPLTLCALRRFALARRFTLAIGTMPLDALIVNRSIDLQSREHVRV